MLSSGEETGGRGIRPGVRIGRYEVLSAIGAGGMGEVWKARDTTLNRDVAIKALPEKLARDSAKLRRLEREAQLLAALNHPNIAVIHGLEAWHDTQVLVLELVDGVTLEDRLMKGALPVGEALKLALPIAESLEAAHNKGIIHRDLKPSNIKVSADGRIKVLDFGIAKAIDAAAGDDSNQTTMTMLTETGRVVGTPSYMAPEQIRGEASGSQADIWSFGVVFYEMLTGDLPFRASTSADTLAQVLGSEPDYAKLPDATPPRVRRLVQRCLDKNRRRRFQHMGDVRFEIEEALAAPTEITSIPTRTSWRSRAVQGGAAAALLVAVAAAGWFVGQRARSTPSATAATLSILFVEPPGGGTERQRSLAISADGSCIAYSSASRLWIRELNRKEPRAIAGVAANPFFSPDGQWVGFRGDLGGPSLLKVRVSGGAPVMIAPTSDRPRGATWGADGTIVFATTEGLYRVSANGGQPTLLIKPNPEKKERLYAWPHFLPDGQSVLYTIVSTGEDAATRIALLNLNSLASRVLIEEGVSPGYVRGGHLAYAAGAALKTIAFDASAGQTRGDAAIVPDVSVQFIRDSGAADFAVSQSGTLVYMPFGDHDAAESLRTLTWIDREGREEPIPLKPARLGYPRISPDGTLVALDVNTGGSRDIWILNLERLSLTQLTDGPTEDMLPVWSPDGRRVFFASDRTGNFDVYSQPADGATRARTEFAAPGVHVPQGFTPDGTGLIVYENFQDIGLLKLAQPDQLLPLLHSEFDDRLAKVSPDGRWIVYESNESGGRFEIFVRPFPNIGDRREQVSIAGGRFPLWARNGSEITYVNLEGEMIAVPVTVSPSLSLGRPVRLFQWVKPPVGRSGSPYDISPKDGRFLVAKPLAQNRSAVTQVSVVLGFLGDDRRH